MCVQLSPVLLNVAGAGCGVVLVVACVPFLFRMLEIEMKIDFRDEESNIEHVLHSKSLRISIYERPQTRIDAPLCELPGSFPLHPVPLFPLG